MATFKYTAFDENEKNLKGFINASDLDEARLILINRGLNPLNIEKTLQKRSKVRISNNNLSIFTKQMSALLSAGTPIEKCLVLLSKQSSNGKFSQILLSINEDITEGNSLRNKFICLTFVPFLFNDSIAILRSRYLTPRIEIK